MSKYKIATVLAHTTNSNLMLRNYFEWRSYFDKYSDDIITIELSFDGHFYVKDSIKIKGNITNFVWQKERLLNLALETLSDDVEYFFWHDNDIVPLYEDSWMERAIEKLDSGVELLQLFDKITYFANDRKTIQKESYGAMSYRKYNSKSIGPGGCWAAKASILKKCGLYENSIVGGGDTITYNGLTGICINNHTHWTTFKHNLDIRRYIEKCRGLFQNIDYLKFDVQHLYHGDMNNRQYCKRHEILLKNHYDPKCDIFIDHKGILASYNRQLVLDIKKYFSLRVAELSDN